MNNYLRVIISILVFFIIDFSLGLILKHGLNLNMGLNEHAKVLIVGHSHLMMGLDRKSMQTELGCKVAKNTRSGIGVEERKLMTEMFLNSKFSDSLRVVVLGVDPYLFNEKDLSQNPYTLFYPWIDDKEVSDYLFKKTSCINYWSHKCSSLSRFTDDTINQSIRGWKNDDRNFKTGVFTKLDFEKKGDKWKREIKFDKKMMRILDENIKMLTDRNIHVVLLQTPLYKQLTDIDVQKYSKMCNYYKGLDSKSRYVHFINYSKQYGDDNSLFFDPVHLNTKGQKIITKLLDDYLKTNFMI